MSRDMPRVFISYSSKDQEWKDKLLRHLQVYEGQELFQVWHDRKVKTGDNWKKKILPELEKAHIAVLLISTDFLISEFIKKQELPIIQEREGRIQLRVVPIVVKPCNWEANPWLEDRQVFPPDHVLSGGTDTEIEEDLASIALDIKLKAEEIKAEVEVISSTSKTAQPTQSDPATIQSGQSESIDKPAEPVALKRALLVGVDYSDSQLPPLSAPANNVEVLGTLLEQFCQFQVTTLLNPDARNLIGAIEEISHKSESGEDLLIYLSGHAAIGSGRGLYFCTMDSEIGRLRATSLPFSMLGECIEEAKAANVTLIVDCRFSGQLKNKTNLKSLVRAQLGGGRRKSVIITNPSVYPNPLSSDDAQIDVFTEIFAEGIKNGNADCNENGIITLLEACQYVERCVAVKENEPLRFDFDSESGNVVLRDIRKNKISGNRSPSRPEMEMRRKIDTEMLWEKLIRGEVIPYLGARIYSDGPFSNYSLAQSLAEEADRPEIKDYPLPQAAEILERGLFKRKDTIECLKSALAKRTIGAAASAKLHEIYDMLLEGWETLEGRETSKPRLIISMTYDTHFEDRLERREIPYTTITHILHQSDNSDDQRKFKISGREVGKILVHNYGDGDTEWKRFAAHKLDVKKCKGVVVYKLVGSPFINDREGVQEEGLDTVILTESDYAKFLGFMNKPGSQTPAFIKLIIKVNSLLFLGYPLDLWQHRLVANTLTGEQAQIPNYAIRVPTSDIEEHNWGLLNTRIFELSLEELRKQARQYNSNKGV